LYVNDLAYVWEVDQTGVRVVASAGMTTETPQVKEKLAKLAYSPEEACQALTIGRTVLYDLMRRGEIVSIKVGRRRIIPVDKLHEYVDRLVAEQNEVPA